MFRKSPTDLVKGIRANKGNEDAFIQTCLEEIRNEVKSTDVKVLACAIQKLTYLHMFGYDMEWAAFPIIQLMSQPQFQYKRIGYLAASMAFHQNTDALIMTTQQFKKDLASSDQYAAGLAITCLANIATPDLARDLVSDVVTLLNSSRKYIRKKAVLVLYKIFMEYPDALRPCYPRLKEKLADSHPSVVASAVNVICELARKNPKNFLPLAAVFYKLLTTLNNNWTLIKIVKLFGALAPEEPRLAKKLVEPMTKIINTTPAKSLLYECLFTVTKGMNKHVGIVRLAVDKLKEFVQDPDQNLKYLGLLGLNNIMPIYPRIISDMKDIILGCLEDKDITIRYRAIDLLCGVVNQKNIKVIIHKLSKHVKDAEGDYRNYLVEKIIATCAQDNYKNIANFKWYLKILIKLTELKGLAHGKAIADQLMNTNIRVKSIRPFGISQLLNVLQSEQIQNENIEESSINEVLFAAAYIIGEFISAAEEEPIEIVKALLHQRLFALPPRIQAAFVQSITKVYSFAANQKPTDESELKAHYDNLAVMRDLIRKNFDNFKYSPDVEVQERAAICLKVLQLHEELLDSGIDIGHELAALFEEDLNPVAKGANRKVPIPEGLDLDNWINEPFGPDEDDRESQGSFTGDEQFYQDTYHGQMGPLYNEEQSKFIIREKKRNKNDPNIPIHDVNELLGTQKKKKGKKKKRVKKEKKEPRIQEPVEILTVEEVPEGAKLDDDVKDDVDSLTKTLGSINLTDIHETEIASLPTIKAYTQKTAEDIRRSEIELRKQKEAEKKKKVEKKKKKGEKTEKKKKKQETGDLLQLDEFLQSPEVTEKPKSKNFKKRLCKDSNIKVTYNNKPIAKDEKTIQLQIGFENVGRNQIKSIQYDIENTSKVRFIKPSNQSGPITAKFSLEAGEFNAETIKIGFKSISQPLKLKGTVTYVTEKGSKTLEFKMTLLCSMFFSPKEITSDALANLIKSNEIPFVSSTTCKFNEKIKDLNIASKEVSKLLHVSVIGNVPGVGQYMYAQSVQQHHMAVLLKIKSDTELLCEIRCTDEKMGSNLLAEVQKLFKKK